MEEETKKRESQEFYKNALDGLLKTNLAKLSEAYDALPDNNSRELYVDGLRQVVGWFEDKDYHCIDRGERLRRTSGFRGEAAKKAREATKISQTELAKLIFTSKRFQSRKSLLSAYETGQIIPTPKSPRAKPYLMWLKEKGYNPFNL